MYYLLNSVSEVKKNEEIINLIVVKNENEEDEIKFLVKKRETEVDKEFEEFFYKFYIKNAPVVFEENSFKIIKAFTKFELFNKLKEFINNNPEFRIISDIKIVKKSGVEVYLIEVAKTDFTILDEI